MDRILNTNISKAYNLILSFPTKVLHKHPSELGLDKPQIKERATQVGHEHLVKTLNRPSQREHLAHVSLLAKRFQHWPSESDRGMANLPTLRLVSCIHTIPGMELSHLPKLHNTNEIAETLRSSPDTVDQIRAANCATLVDIQDPKEYNKHCRQICNQLRASTVPITVLRSMRDVTI